MPHFYGAVNSPAVGHHQWKPYSRRPLVVGSAYHKHLVRLMLQELRRGDPAPEYGLRVSSFLLMLLVHVGMFFSLLVGQPPGPPPPSAEQMASVQVRMIEEHKPPPPPPPPPIHLKKRVSRTHQTRRVPPQVKRAPIAAMPAIPVQSPPQPQIKFKQSKPEVSAAKIEPQALPRVAASPAEPVPPTPKIVIAAAVPKVVLETSKMAVPPPETQPLQEILATATATDVETAPASHQAPRIVLGKQALKMSTGAPVLSMPKPVAADTPEVPTIDTVAPKVTITSPPNTKPRIDLAVSHPDTMPTQHVEPTPLAPIPQAPVGKVAPTLNLPVAQVSVAQAPQVDIQAPVTHVQATAVPDEAAAVNPATAASAAQSRHTAKASADTSWAPANDQFKPLGEQRKRGAGAGHNALPGKAGEASGTVELMPRGNSNVMGRSTDHLGYKSTIFEQYWAPKNEDLLTAFLRHFVEKLTIDKTFQVAPGVRVRCVVGPLAIFFACGGGDPPRRASTDSDDPRLNMAPARPLVPGLGASSLGPKRAPVKLNNDAKCDVARIAGGPPPPGCPGAPIKPSQSDQWYPSGG